MTDSNDVLEHGDWRHAADVINMITKHAALWRNGTCPLYVATPEHFNAGWRVSPLRQVLRMPLPEMEWLSEDVLGGEGLVFIGDQLDSQHVVFRDASRANAAGQENAREQG